MPGPTGVTSSSVGRQLGKAECLRSFWQAACVFGHPPWTQTFMAGEAVLSTCRGGPQQPCPTSPTGSFSQPLLCLLCLLMGAGPPPPPPQLAQQVKPSLPTKLSSHPQGGRIKHVGQGSALCCFSFPFPQINRPPQRETNAFVSEAGRTVRMACLPVSRQGLAESPKATGSPAMQPKSLLTVLLLRRGAFGEGWGFCPLLVPLQESHG